VLLLHSSGEFAAVAHGDRLERPVPVAEAAAARHGWPLVVVDGAGDDPPMEQPAAFLDAFRSA
jgi:pimeloyl-ACP methyl ester carboxylesterase